MQEERTALSKEEFLSSILGKDKTLMSEQDIAGIEDEKDREIAQLTRNNGVNERQRQLDDADAQLKMQLPESTELQRQDITTFIFENNVGEATKAFLEAAKTQAESDLHEDTGKKVESHSERGSTGDPTEDQPRPSLREQVRSLRAAREA